MTNTVTGWADADPSVGTTAQPPYGGNALAWQAYFAVNEPPHHLIDRIFDPAGTLIIGAPTVGKSFMALDICATLIARERSFLGQAVHPEPHRVLYVSTDPRDSGENAKRFLSMVAEVDLAEHGSSISFDRLTHDPTDSATWGQWGRELLNAGTTVIVLDNITTAAGELADLNNSAGAGPILARLGELSELGIGVLAVGHTSKGFADGTGGGRTALGSQRFTAWFRSTVRLTRKTQTSPVKISVESNNAAPLELWATRRSEGRLDWCDPPTKEQAERRPLDAPTREKRKRVDLVQAQRVIDDLPEQDRGNHSAMGRALHTAGLVASDAAGRRYIGRMRNQLRGVN